MSTSAPSIGLPFLSLNQALTNSAGPGVGERTIEPPFGVTGECMRQNGPSRLASVSTWPLSPLLSMQISCEKTERAGDQHRFVMGRVRMLAELDDVGHRLAELLLGELHLAREVVQVAHEGRHDLLEARIGRALQLGQHRLGDVFLLFDDHGPAPARFRPQTHDRGGMVFRQ